MILGISTIDWLMLALYFGATVAIGFYTASKVKDTTDFFMGGRRFGKVFMVFFAFGAGTSGNDAVGVSSKTFTNGLSGIWYQWLWLFCTPFYWLIAPVMRRMRCLTTGDYFEHRYDGSVAGLYTIIGVGQLTVNIGVIQLGAGSMIEGMSNGGIHKEWAILAMTALFVVYGIAGGLAAAIVTDFMQGILTVILSFMLVPFALDAVGGFSGLHEGITDPQMFSLVAPGEINLFWIVMLGLNSLIGIVTQPHIMGVCAAGRTEMDGRVGFAGGNLIKRLCTIAWMVVGLCAVVMYAGTEIGPDHIFGQAAADLLPQIMNGLVGVFMAALLASVMSSCDAFMVSCSGLFTQNFYRRWIEREKPDSHYVWVGRIASLGIVAGGLSFAFLVTNVPAGLVWFFKLQALMGAAFWVGLFWRRATVLGAWTATLVQLVILFGTSMAGFHAWAVENLPDYMIWDGKFRDSWQILCYLVAGFGTHIAVSLVTPRVPTPQLDRVFNAIRTPVMVAEPHTPEPFMLPANLPVANPRKVIDHPDLEIYWPSRLALGGFAIFWAFVAILIGFVYWMAGWGA
jgi:Na+/proline symporter